MNYGYLFDVTKGAARPTANELRDLSETNLALLAKALSHPARLSIIQMLFERQTCIGCDIVDQIGLAQSTTSEHLRILKTAGIITGDIDPPRVCYSLKPESLLPLIGFLRNVSQRPEKESEDI